MEAKEFSTKLYEEMVLIIGEEKDNYSLERARDASLIIIDMITRLRTFMNSYRFKNKIAEINFFKSIKPKFQSNLIYYQKLFEIFSFLPVGMENEVHAYYQQHLNIARNYFERHKDILTYYKSGSHALDEIYFLTRKPDLWLLLNSEECEHDNFTTIYDNILSRLLAYEKLSHFLIASINDLNIQPHSPMLDGTKDNTHTVTWTASKAALIELLYAVQTSGSCNNGTIEVKELAVHFENLFNVKLGNFYRTFQEIRIRKISRTSYLDQLKQVLIHRMDESDENPRF